jgi:4-hydroxybenzoate polyprenyltransferase/phosphoserine phosphatase
MSKEVPLFVDLDGTLTPADVSLESFVDYARNGLGHASRLSGWLLKGRSLAKARVAQAMPVDPARLPIRSEVLALIEAARAEGSRVILASASDQANVQRVADHLGCFDSAIGSTATHNLKGGNKLAAIRAMAPDAPFDYAGDARADLPIWKAARRGYSAGFDPRLENVRQLVMPPSPARMLFKAMRPHQWAKNALIFVPLLTAGLAAQPQAILLAGLAMLCFSLVASGVYLINDLLDIPADRMHKTKCKRPLAAGTLSIPLAIVSAALLMSVPLLAALLLLGLPTALVLLAYLILTTAYSFRLKAVMTLDVITLACLYTVRIIAGATAIHVRLSFWLFTFSVFFFLSLAYLKRYTELTAAADPGKLVKGRGYLPEDLRVVETSGISAGMLSILVLALFINSLTGSLAYATPELLWLLCLPLLYWINRVWMMARRGQVDGDPVAFAIRDGRSLITAAFMGLIVLVAQKVPLTGF